MIIGCGIDLIETKRIMKIIDKWGKRFTYKAFSPLERQYCERKKNGYQSFAGKFAAKEALLKALGIGLRKVSWRDIEVANNKLGQPNFKISGNLKNIIFQKDVNKIFITISHTKDYAIAEVILENLLDK